MTADLLNHPQFRHAVHVLENLKDHLGASAVHLAAAGVAGVREGPALPFPDDRRSDAEAALVALLAGVVHFEQTGDASWIATGFGLGVEFMEQHPSVAAIAADNSHVAGADVPIEDAG